MQPPTATLFSVLPRHAQLILVLSFLRLVLLVQNFNCHGPWLLSLPFKLTHPITPRRSVPSAAFFLLARHHLVRATQPAVAHVCFFNNTSVATLSRRFCGKRGQLHMHLERFVRCTHLV